MVRGRASRTRIALGVLLCTLAGPVPSARAQYSSTPSRDGNPAQVFNKTPPELNKVDVEEHLGGSLPLDARFTDSDGKAVKLGDYFDAKRPVLLVFAYHTCPMLCSLVLDATTRGLGGVPWTVGKEFDVVSISIDPRDTPASATKKRDEVAAKYGRSADRTHGWHFLVGDEIEIRKVTDAVGFQYKYDERQGQYAHPAAVYVATPKGTLARYLYGIQFDPGDLRLGLLEASEGRSIGTVEKLLLYCYHYDPQGKKYAVVAMNVMRLGGVVTMLLLGGLLTTLWLRERRRAAVSLTAATRPPRSPALEAS